MDHSRRIMITGATSALAKATADAAVHRTGYELLLISRSAQDEYICTSGTRVQQVTGIDLADERNCKLLHDSAEAFFSGSFSVVHFAGDFWRHKSLCDTPFPEVRSMITSHFLTLCNVAQAITPLMIRHGAGRLVAFSCNSVAYCYPDMAPFTAAKAAIESFVRCYAHEHAEFGLSSTVLALPTTRTPKVIQEKPQGDHDHYVTPNELADLLLDEVLTQNQYVTGNVVRLFRYSRSFYNQGYFERNPREANG